MDKARLAQIKTAINDYMQNTSDIESLNRAGVWRAENGMYIPSEYLTDKNCISILTDIHQSRISIEEHALYPYLKERFKVLGEQYIVQRCSIERKQYCEELIQEYKDKKIDMNKLQANGIWVDQNNNTILCEDMTDEHLFSVSKFMIKQAMRFDNNSSELFEKNLNENPFFYYMKSELEIRNQPSFLNEMINDYVQLLESNNLPRNEQVKLAIQRYEKHKKMSLLNRIGIWCSGDNSYYPIENMTNNHIVSVALTLIKNTKVFAEQYQHNWLNDMLSHPFWESISIEINSRNIKINNLDFQAIKELEELRESQKLERTKRYHENYNQQIEYADKYEGFDTSYLIDNGIDPEEWDDYLGIGG